MSIVFNQIIQSIKDRSDYYPKILKGESVQGFYLSTLVRIERDGIWYAIHHLEFSVINQPNDLIQLFQKFILKIHYTQNAYVITNEEKDTLQESELERLKKLYTFKQKP